MQIINNQIVTIFSVLLFLLLGGIGSEMKADEFDSEAQKELWSQPDFVRAYYVIAEPGENLYSIFGHACLHMVCDTYGLDYFFSYESENAASKFLKFLSGNLKMGMRGMYAEDYLSEMKENGRGVKEYEMNLPIDVKRELWRVLDEKMAEGMDLPYDFESRGCGYACVMALNEALGDKKIEYGDWSPRFNRTRREMCNDFGKYDYPWNMMLIMALVGTDVDKMLTPEEKLIIPTEIVEVWQNAKIDGEYILSHDAHVILPSKKKHEAVWLTPMIVALLILVLAAVSWLVKVPYIDWLVLGIATLIGVFVTYLVVFSSLPCTNWNWLIIPFNILPAICWKWRKYWSLPYAIIIAVWVCCMLASLHQLVDYSMIVIALALMLIFFKNSSKDFFERSIKE